MQIKRDSIIYDIEQSEKSLQKDTKTAEGFNKNKAEAKQKFDLLTKILAEEYGYTTVEKPCYSYGWEEMREIYT